MGTLETKRNSIWWLQMSQDDLWYLVGLLAADGCLSGDGRHIDITAKERSFLESLKQRCGIPQKIAQKKNGRGQIAHRIQIGSVSFYRFLLDIGMMPNKSKRIGELRVPDDSFHHFLRGIIDGDGSIRRWIHPSNGGEQWSLRITGASRPFMSWLMRATRCLMGALGKLHEETNGASVKYILKFGKIAAQRLLSICYREGDVSLERKELYARRCIQSERGWRRSKTVLDRSTLFA